MSKQPLQYHYVVWAEQVNGKTQWHVEIDSSFLDNGSVFDPSKDWGNSWSCIDDPEKEETDNYLFAELLDLLNANPSN